jgi:Raf kinase inhibitor-like YbhB/YbcL family protein
LSVKHSRFLQIFVAALMMAVGAGCGGASDVEVIPPPSQTAAPTHSSAAETANPQAATSTPEPAAATGPFTLSSPAFKDGEQMNDRYSFNMFGQCNGENYSPALSWTGAPAGTQSFAITVIDPDGGNWLHWLQFNIPADATSLPEAVGGPDIGVKGANSFGKLGYGGPCPPSGNHHYIFTLYALDRSLDLKEGAKLNDLTRAMDGHILAQAQLTGLKKR